MSKVEYIEGPEALARFERLATMALRASPKKKKKQAKKPASRKPKKPDKD